MFEKLLRPAFTKSLKQKLSLCPNPGRELHTFAGKTRPEVVIGSNAMLYATAASILAHEHRFGKNIHSQLRFIAPPFWVDSVHTDHDTQFWGQRIDEMPRFLRELLVHRLGKNELQGHLTFVQYKELRRFTIEILTSGLRVPVYKGRPTISVLDEQLQFNIESVTGNVQVLMPDNTFVYDWHRDYTPDAHIPATILQPSHTLLYQLPLNMIPKEIMLLGDNEAVLRLAEHFPESTIYYLSNADTIDPLAQYRRISNLKTELSNAIKIPFDSTNREHFKYLGEPQCDQEIPFCSKIRYFDPINNIDINGHFFTCLNPTPQNHTSMLSTQNVLRSSDFAARMSFIKSVPNSLLSAAIKDTVEE